MAASVPDTDTVEDDGDILLEGKSLLIGWVQPKDDGLPHSTRPFQAGSSEKETP